MDERSAVERLKRGDIGGLEILVYRYQVQTVRAAYLVTQDRQLAEDFVQAAFLRAYERIGQLKADRLFGPWFLRSVVNDAVKAAARRERLVSLNQSPSADDLVLAELIADPAPVPRRSGSRPRPARSSTRPLTGSHRHNAL
jgi:RNA polymerase sigma-70 factor (ECF subfamily)